MCAALTPPDNGSLDPVQKVYDLNQVVTFTCDTGYALAGNRQLTCLATKEWDGVEPTCQGTV